MSHSFIYILIIADKKNDDVCMYISVLHWLFDVFTKLVSIIGGYECEVSLFMSGVVNNLRMIRVAD